MARNDANPPMPEFSTSYVLQEVDPKWLTQAVKPKQFLHIDQAECILCEGCVDICPWNCTHMVSVSAINDAINTEQPGEDPRDHVAFIVDEDICTRCALCVDRCPTGVIILGKLQTNVAEGKAGKPKTRVTFDGTLTDTDTHAAAEGESWTIIMQRAWIQYHGNGGRTWPHEAIFALSGRQSDARYSIQDSDFARLGTALSQGKVVVTATNNSPVGSLVGAHAYAVVQTWGSGSNAWVQVRNPWGSDGGSTSDSNPNDGLVWVRWSDFRASMDYLAVA